MNLELLLQCLHLLLVFWLRERFLWGEYNVSKRWDAYALKSPFIYIVFPKCLHVYKNNIKKICRCHTCSWYFKTQSTRSSSKSYQTTRCVPGTGICPRTGRPSLMNVLHMPRNRTISSYSVIPNRMSRNLEKILITSVARSCAFIDVCSSLVVVYVKRRTFLNFVFLVCDSFSC